MPEQWRVFSQDINYRKMYIAGRQLDSTQPLHGGNVEYFGGYSENREAVESLVAELNGERSLSLTPEAQRRLERILREELDGAQVIASSVSVGEAGEVSVDEIILRMPTGAAWAIEMNSKEERLVLTRYNGPGGWSPTNPQRPEDWEEVTAQDLVEEDL